MKLLFYFFFFLILFSCQETNPEQEYYVVEAYRKDSTKVKTPNKYLNRPGFKTYKNSSYHIALEYPKDWNVHEMDIEDSIPVINLHAIQDTYSHNFPVFINSNPQLAHVSFYPEGMANEITLGLSRPFEGFEKDLPIPFSINEKESKVFLLENLQVYGYYLKPASPPPGWNKEGFIYVQIAVDGFYLTCFELKTGLEKSLKECNQAEGDKLRKYGNLNEASRRAILDILSTVHFYEDIDNPQVISDLIKVISPEPYQDVKSSLIISGEALQTWYNKSEFPVIITDAEYQVLASGHAKMKQKNTNDEFIPFEATLDFKNPVHNNGYIILRRANASRKPEKDRSLIVPVRFPPIN